MDASSLYVWNIKFINEVEKRPGIWNQSVKSRDLEKSLWEELSGLYNGKSVDSLKRKYKSLKARFAQQLNTIPQTNDKYDIDPRSFKSDWPHYEQMLFLLNEIEAKKAEKGKLTSQGQDHVSKKKRIDDIDTNVSEKLPEPNSHHNENMLNEATPTEIIVRPNIVPVPRTDDGLYHFLMSLYSSMNELDPIRKINVQARIYAMLSQEMTAAANK